MATAIAVEGVSKSYLLHHERRETYRTLRDTVANGARRLARRARGALGGPPPRGQTTELFWALHDVSLRIEEGERVGIIGRNGAGKSTLLKILSRITEPSAGEVRLRGRVASLLEVGTGFHPELSGRENIFLNGAVLGMRNREIERRFDEIVAFAEVERFLDTPVKRYSSGMYVRLAFAVAAHLDPEILIVDEVLAVGDAQFQKKCLGKMESAGRDGRTVLLVSHNLQTILTLCTRGVLLEQGRVALAGSADEVVAAYRDLGALAQTEREWPLPESRPGNEHMRVHAVRIRADAAGGASRITIRTPFEVEVTYDIGFSAGALYAAVRLKTATGADVFSSPSAPAPVAPGRYRARCQVPGDLLNDGVYSIDIAFARDGVHLVFRLEDALTFEVHDVERARGAWLGPIPGAVRPQLMWNIDRLEAA